MNYKIILFFLFLSLKCFSQNHPPWESPLKISLSTDGINFNSTAIFQDSSGVPCLIKWKNDTLVSVFQWFRQPMNSPSWDRVAVKFSYDNGFTWTQPVPILINGLPGNYQRPFDPALVALSSDSLRIYYSSSDGLPMQGLDSTINTYSAISSDGINYTFESGPRYDHPTNRVIDPSVIYFNGNWNYLAPIGAPQDGAYHATSSDGIIFNSQVDYISDNMHNWTGNFMEENSGELRFYGSGAQIWYNASSDGLSWQGYVNTNLIGGDPSVLKTGNSNYIAIYVGQPYNTSINENETVKLFYIYPNPTKDYVKVKNRNSLPFKYYFYSSEGKLELQGNNSGTENISTFDLPDGIHFLKLLYKNYSEIIKVIKYVN